MAERKLKVYGGNLDGRRQAIMATTSFNEFRRATGISRDYGSKTGNAADVAAAMATPGVVLVRPMGREGPYQVLERADSERSEG